MEQEPKNLGQLRKLEEGEAIMEAKCAECGWTNKKIFDIGDQEREWVCMKLEDLHEETGCKGKLEFDEIHSN